ncbi:hypothetical protein V1L54_04000 [Streptomyces sp. TRM 70361]|uniref:hypothetical protein n=1 Tax=Streptomyces sp. TRM 70361 TaxID=3116553 RepID=UPI002E7B5E47|nr:hypothetical protein [Streptomyces sp. TRM 70361]MEE1938581.1 hypothetical protein [Streptomyces sp. TRM 70361]
MPARSDAPARPLLWGPSRVPVPYVAAWSAEAVSVAGALTVRPGGAGLAHGRGTG